MKKLFYWENLFEPAVSVYFSQGKPTLSSINATKTTSGDIPTQTIKMTSDLSFNKVTSIANSMVQSCTFPDALRPRLHDTVFRSYRIG